MATKFEAGDNGSIQVEVFRQILSANASDKLVGAIDQGTSSSRFVLFTSKGEIAASAQTEHPQIYPQPGWHEHDPVVLWKNTAACMREVMAAIPKVNQQKVTAIGVTNQRETTIAWNKETGKPYYNAIVWDDTRTQDIAASIQNVEQLTATTGLPSSSYFAGTKVKWLLDNVKALREDVEKKPQVVCFGTVDTWLLYQLTGSFPKSKSTGKKLKGKNLTNVGGIFQTDVTNASRWLFLDLKTSQWDPTSIATVCAPHTLPVDCLPAIQPSSHVFGKVSSGCGLPQSLVGVPLASVLGDQQAALFGQAAFSPGQAKNTYGTGLFLMMNTGAQVPSKHGLLTTIAYQIGTDGPVVYALEGSVSHSGSTIQWLRDQLDIIPDAPASETEARRVPSNEGLYFVPAFAGLLAPHWRPDARACLVGMTAAHHKGHVCRAALEATCYQTRDVFAAIESDSGVRLQSLKVDGGGTHNELMMQFQADMIQVPVVQPVVMETTAMGAAFAAGLAVGVWKDTDEIAKLWAVAKTYEPRMEEKERELYLAGWNKAITRSLGWIGDAADDAEGSEKKNGVAVKTRALPIASDSTASSPMVFAGGLAVACLLGVVIGRLSATKK